MSEDVPENFSTSCLWQLIDNDDMLETSNRSNVFPDPSNQFLGDVLFAVSSFDHHKANRNLSLQLLNLGDYCSLIDTLMAQ